MNSNIVDLYSNIIEFRRSDDILRDCYMHVPELEQAIYNNINGKDPSTQQLNLNFISRRISNLIDTYPSVWNDSRKKEIAESFARIINTYPSLKVMGVMFMLHVELVGPFFKSLYNTHGNFLVNNVTAVGLAYLHTSIREAVTTQDYNSKTNLKQSVVTALNESNLLDTNNLTTLNACRSLSISINNLYYGNTNELWDNLNSWGKSTFLSLSTLAYNSLTNSNNLNPRMPEYDVDSTTEALYGDYISGRKNLTDFISEQFKSVLSKEELKYINTYLSLSSDNYLSINESNKLINEIKMPHEEALSLPSLS